MKYNHRWVMHNYDNAAKATALGNCTYPTIKLYDIFITAYRGQSVMASI